MMDLASSTPPPEWTWRPTFEARLRYERRVDPDFLSSAADNRTEWYARLRPGLVGEGPGKARITFVYQFGYSESENPTRTTVRQNSDVFLANAVWTSGRWQATAGRFIYRLGDGRLVCGLQGWGNVGRSYDGLRATGQGWDLFALKPAVNTNLNREETVAGGVRRTGLGETYGFVYQNDRTAELTRLGQVGHLWKGDVGRVKGTLEGVVQFGHTNGVETEAWMLFARASTAIGPKTTLAVEAMAASGGNGGDKDRRFFAPYPTMPTPYGMDTLFGYRNLNNLSVVADHQVSKTVSLHGHVDFPTLRDPRDGWYGLSNSVNRGPNGAYRDPTGAAGRDLGWFWQIDAKWKPLAGHTVSAGYAILYPGDFQKRLNGGRADQQSWGYVEYLYRF